MDLYPEDLSFTFEVMRTVETKKKKVTRLPTKQPTGDRKADEVQLGAESFAQTAKEEDVVCYCCGEKGEYLSDCKLKKDIAEKDWFKNMGIKHYLKKVNTQTLAGAKVKEVEATKEVGFVGVQIAQDGEEPDILLDSGSTISLFKDKQFLSGVKDVKIKLVMETNAGSHAIGKKGVVKGSGEVWHDDKVVSNLFGLSDMVRRGYCVTYDSRVSDAFVFHTKNEDTIHFPVDERKGIVLATEVEGFTTREVE